MRRRESRWLSRRRRASLDDVGEREYRSCHRAPRHGDMHWGSDARLDGLTQVLSVQECGLGAHAMERESWVQRPLIFAGALTPPTLDALPERSRRICVWGRHIRVCSDLRQNLPEKRRALPKFCSLNPWRAACPLTRVDAPKAQVVGGEAS